MASFFKSLYVFLIILWGSMGIAQEIETLDLDVISYEDFVSEKPEIVGQLIKALYEKGIVGIKGIPGYREKTTRFIDMLRMFSTLPHEVKGRYAQKEGEVFLGYEEGKEKFKRSDGKWVVDDLKNSFYVLFPDQPENKWPTEIDLKTPFLDLAHLMNQMGEAVMIKIGLLAPHQIDDVPSSCRMLHYSKNTNSQYDNPFWCGAHLDHGLFTAIIPATYFMDGKRIEEPAEAGLFVRTSANAEFKKVLANDPDVLLFQVGEFAQLASHDKIRATEHRVHKAQGSVDRFTLAVFFNARPEEAVYSFSELTQDNRYGGQPGDPCTYGQWHQRSFERYIVKGVE